MGQPTITYSGPANTGARLIAPGSEEFGRDLPQLTRGVTDKLFESTLPYSVIVKNDGPRYIAALTVLYRLKDASGIANHKFYLGSLISLRSQLMPPGQARLIGPVMSIYTGVNHGRYSGLDLGSTAVQQNVQRDVDLCANQDQIQISLDAVIFEDGEFIGADESKTFRAATAELRALGELRAAAAQKNGFEMRKHLEQILSRPEKPSRTFLERDDYDHKLHSVARMMLHELDMSEELFRNHVAGNAEVALPRIYRRNQ